MRASRKSKEENIFFKMHVTEFT